MIHSNYFFCCWFLRADYLSYLLRSSTSSSNCILDTVLHLLIHQRVKLWTLLKTTNGNYLENTNQVRIRTRLLSAPLSFSETRQHMVTFVSVCNPQSHCRSQLINYCFQNVYLICKQCSLFSVICAANFVSSKCLDPKDRLLSLLKPTLIQWDPITKMHASVCRLG